MPVPFIQQNFLKYNKGKGFISGHVEALHAMPPAADKFTDKIAEKLIEKQDVLESLVSFREQNVI